MKTNPALQWCGALAHAASRFIPIAFVFAIGSSLSAATYPISDTDLTVTLNDTAGTITVLDKGNNVTWNQSAAGSHTAFTVIGTTAGSITFVTTFFPDTPSDGAVAYTNSISLTGRKLTYTCFAGPNPQQAEGRFNYLEPFASSSSMSVVVPFSDGRIFPANLTSWPNGYENLANCNVTMLSMPWAGVVNTATGAGYSVTWNTPYDAQMQLIAVNGNRAPLTGWFMQRGSLGYNRQLTYYFTANGGYLDLAANYRAGDGAPYVKALGTKASTRPNIAKSYGAALLWDMLDHLSDVSLRAMGVIKANHHADFGDHSGTGGKRGNVDNANALGFLTEEYDYYQAGNSTNSPESYDTWGIMLSEVAHDANGNMKTLGAGWYERSSFCYLTNGQAIIPKRLGRMPYSSRYIDQMTQDFLGSPGSVDEDYTAIHTRTRSQWAADEDAFYSYLAGTLGLLTGAEVGKWHQVPNTEFFYGMQTTWWPWCADQFATREGDSCSSSADWTNYRQWHLNPTLHVPLWELVFGDSSIASLYPFDPIDACYRLANNDLTYQGVKDAQCILYGQPPLFLCIDNGQSPFNDVTTSSSTYRPRWLQTYRNTSVVSQNLAGQQMLSHRFLTADRNVQQTTWSDGTTNIVNFGTTSYIAPDGSVLPQNGFWVKGPWGSAIKAGTSRAVTTLRSAGYYFDDAQGTAPLPVQVWQVANDFVRVNVGTNLSAATTITFNPANVQATWNYANTHVYKCDTNGGVIGPVAFTVSGNNITVSGLSGWVILNAIDIAPAALSSYQAVVTNSSPLVYYTFTPDVVSAPVANNIGTVAGLGGVITGASPVSGPTTTGMGTGNKAQHFDGTNYWVDLGNPTALNFAGQITMEAWIKPSATQGSFGNIIAHGVNNLDTAEVMMRITGGNYYQIGSWDGRTAYGVSCLIPAGDYGTWVHLVGTYDGTKWNLYRNGALIASANGSKGSMTVGANWTIGGRFDGTRLFNGDIDEIAVYNRALTATEVLNHYNAR
jgi:Concanavalin A-like lectin/glucanases superfamily/Glycosyl hydrolases related to GH101 family, GH129